MRDQRLRRSRPGRAGLVVERHRRRRHLLVAGALAMRGAAVVADHPQHGLAVLLVAGEGAELLGHLGRGRVGDAGHDGGERAADARGRRPSHRGCRRSSAGRRYWRSRGRACGTRRRAARSAWTGTAPSAPRFPAPRSTAAPRARKLRRRSACRLSSRKVSRLSEARLQAVSSRNMYSEHGLEARIGPEAGQVCQSLIVVWNCRPGSAQAQAA